MRNSKIAVDYMVIAVLRLENEMEKVLREGTEEQGEFYVEMEIDEQL